MLFNKENIMLIEDWTLPDLFNSKFWNKVIFAMSDGRNFPFEAVDYGERGTNPILEDKFRKDQMIEFMWELLPNEHKVSFFENEYSIYYIWSSDISIENLITFHDFLVNREFSRISDLISSTNVYKKMVESRNKAFSDMNSKIDTKDVVLMKFYDKLTDEEVISLNTPDYVMVSGTNEEKVKILNDKLLKEEYTMLYMMDYRSIEGTFPIYVFHPKKLK